MVGMDLKMIESSARGIKSLLKYIDTFDKKYLENIKDSFDSLRLWAIVTTITSNNDELFDGISLLYLEKIFKREPIPKVDSQSFFEYGEGIESTYDGNYLEQVRIIRNCLAHGLFLYKDGKVYLNSGRDYKAIIDLKWLESLTYIALANNDQSLEKGQVNVAFIVSGNINPKSSIKEIIEKKELYVSKTTLVSDDRGKISKKLLIDKFGVKSEELNFRLIVNIMQKLLLHQSNIINKSFYTSVEQATKVLNNKFSSIIKIEPVKLDIRKIPFLDNELFLNMGIGWKLQSVINYLSTMDKCRFISLNLQYLMNVIYCSENNIELSDFDHFNFIFSRDFLLKIYANIIFMSFMTRFEENKEIENEIIDKYRSEMDLSFVHAKNICLDVLKVSQRSLDGLQDKEGYSNERRRLKKRIEMTKRNLKQVENNDLTKKLFANIRHALIHNWVEYTDSDIILLNIEREFTLPFFNKKGQMYERVIKSKGARFKCQMSKKAFEEMLDDLYGLLGVNIDLSDDMKLVRNENR